MIVAGAKRRRALVMVVACAVGACAEGQDARETLDDGDEGGAGGGDIAGYGGQDVVGRGGAGTGGSGRGSSAGGATDPGPGGQAGAGAGGGKDAGATTAKDASPIFEPPKDEPRPPPGEPLLYPEATDGLALPAVFGHRMVLQRDGNPLLWGRTAKGATVTVELAGRKLETVADAEGRFRIGLGRLTAGGPHQLVVSTSRATVKFDDVLVGDVWLWAGQSNVVGTESFSESLPRLRFEKAGGWQAATGGITVSQVAFLFARALVTAHPEVPVGVIVRAVSGTAASRWVRSEAVQKHPALASLVTNRGAFATGSLFDQHVRPLVPFGVRGFGWWQGEKEGQYFEDEPPFPLYRYTDMFETLIRDWRTLWGVASEAPFLFVQMPSYKPADGPGAGSDRSWAWVREWQRQTLLRVPGTGMSVGVDLGPGGLHPGKEAPAARLATWARAQVYGDAVGVSGPIATGAKREGSSLRVSFRYGAGLSTKGGAPVAALEVAGAAGTFHAATATIDGETLLVKSAAVAEPVTVRFAYGRTIEPVTLTNATGLPASPFILSVDGVERY